MEHNMVLFGQVIVLSNEDILLVISGILIIFLIFILFKAVTVINVLRYELITFSDWSANKLDIVSCSATEAIVKEVLTFRPHLKREDALGFVPYDVSDAFKEWEKECDRMQNRLKRNGIEVLDNSDKQFLLSPWFH
jgi:hypothetical protein